MLGIPWQECFVHEGGSVLPAIVEFLASAADFLPTLAGEQYSGSRFLTLNPGLRPPHAEDLPGSWPLGLQSAQAILAIPLVRKAEAKEGE